MKKNQKEQLIQLAKNLQTKDDPSHRIDHILRVLGLALKIAKKEKADLEIIIPAVLFHDIVVYRKDSPESKNETEESAEKAGEILSKLNWYPKEKIETVKTCIRECSFSKGILPETIEGKTMQDADRLESTGVISIMRTFSSGGQMNRSLYFENDPFREQSIPLVAEASLDLFFIRLLKIAGTMRTETGFKMAKKRHVFLLKFLKQLKTELKESNRL
jgi:uncharacterized protein